METKRYENLYEEENHLENLFFVSILFPFKWILITCHKIVFHRIISWKIKMEHQTLDKHKSNKTNMMRITDIDKF